MHYLKRILIISLIGCVVCPVAAQRNSGRTGTNWDLKNVEPFFSGGLEIVLVDGKTERSSLETISVKLESVASVAVDMERLRLVMSWTGRFLRLPLGRDVWLEGVPHPVGQTAFKMAPLPGWAKYAVFENTMPPVKVGGSWFHPGRRRGAWRNGVVTIGTAPTPDSPTPSAKQTCLSSPSMW